MYHDMKNPALMSGFRGLYWARTGDPIGANAMFYRSGWFTYRLKQDVILGEATAGNPDEIDHRIRINTLLMNRALYSFAIAFWK